MHTVVSAVAMTFITLNEDFANIPFNFCIQGNIFKWTFYKCEYSDFRFFKKLHTICKRSCSHSFSNMCADKPLNQSVQGSLTLRS